MVCGTPSSVRRKSFADSVSIVSPVFLICTSASSRTSWVSTRMVCGGAEDCARPICPNSRRRGRRSGAARMSSRILRQDTTTRRIMMSLMFHRVSIACAALLAGLVLGSGSGFAQGDAFSQRFNAVLSQHGVVGGAVAIVHSQEPARNLFFGEARKAAHQPVDSETSYNWASITKTMTAIAILQLRDRGKLSLSDPAVRYVPELRQGHDAFGPIDAITIRELLTHSAGFRNPTWPWDCDDASNCDWQPFEPTQWAQVSAMLPYTHIASTPGSRWSYSNLGYVFLGQIIQRLSGDDFEVYVNKNILKPLGMTNSYFDRSPYFRESHV